MESKYRDEGLAQGQVLTIGELGSAQKVGGVFDIGLELSLALHTTLGYRVLEQIALALVLVLVLVLHIKQASIQVDQKVCQ